jgi:predicted signal transduction protein with EAL and GGDEF domain
LTLGDREVVVTLSLGVAAAAGADAHPAELMGQADHELYRAKRTRNAVSAAHLHDPLDFVPNQRPGEPTSRVPF